MIAQRAVMRISSPRVFYAWHSQTESPCYVLELLGKINLDFDLKIGDYLEDFF